MVLEGEENTQLYLTLLGKINIRPKATTLSTTQGFWGAAHTAGDSSCRIALHKPIVLCTSQIQHQPRSFTLPLLFHPEYLGLLQSTDVDKIALWRVKEGHVHNATKHFLTILTWKHICWCMQMGSLSSVHSARKALANIIILKGTWKFTQWRNHINVQSAKRPSPRGNI